jgi:hypothetical protein
MNRTLIKRTCVTIRRATRHPTVQRTFRSSRYLRKHVIRAATLSLVPSTVNDVVFHHTPLNAQEVIHAASDTVAIGTMNAIVAIIITGLKHT